MRGMIRNGVALGVIALLAAACGSSSSYVIAEQLVDDVNQYVRQRRVDHRLV